MAADERELNLDPITHAPGAHPVGTGIGAASGGIAGAAIGAVGGPLGAALGLAAGAVAGGLAGKAAAEGVNPTAEEAYWRENYQREPYYQADRSYDDYGPAYAYGWGARVNYPSNFDEAEVALARDWERQRGASTLAWEQARPATRAAWERLDSPDRTRPAQDMDEVRTVLEDLRKTSRDGEMGFREAAERTKTAALIQVFEQRARACAQAGTELRELIVQLGGEDRDGGSVTGALHRGWVTMRGSVGAVDDMDMLEECERGEDVALARYRKALENPLPADVRALVQRQLEGTQRNHDQIKLLRDAERARKG